MAKPILTQAQLEDCIDRYGLPYVCTLLACICRAKDEVLRDDGGTEANLSRPTPFSEEWARRANTFRNLSRKFAGDRVGPVR